MCIKSLTTGYGTCLNDVLECKITFKESGYFVDGKNEISGISSLIDEGFVTNSVGDKCMSISGRWVNFKCLLIG